MSLNREKEINNKHLSCKDQFSFFQLSEKKNIPNVVLILDHDETIANSERKSNGDYVVQADGSINATIMDKIKLKRIVDFAIAQNVPIHIVTARADIPNNRSIIEKIIHSVKGFHSGLGGFKKDYIHFTSIMENGVRKTIFTKAEVIKQIHKTKYPHLPHAAFLFVDDMQEYLVDVSKEGYLTLQAHPRTKEHFELIVDFILKSTARPNLQVNSLK